MPLSLPATGAPACPGPSVAVASSTVVTPTVPALLVSALGVGALVGCTDRGRPGPIPSSSPATPDPDAPALIAALAREEALLAAYDVISGDPVLQSQVDAARAHHSAHRDALRAVAERIGVPTAATPSTSAIPTPVVDPVTTARGLVDLERRSSEAGVLSAGAAATAPIARLLAEVAASEAQHATALFIALREGQLRRPAPGVAASPAAPPTPSATP